MKWFRYLLVLVIVLLVGVLGAQWLVEHGRSFGEVLVRAGGYDFSTSLPGAAVVLLLALAVLWLLWTLLSLPFRAWHRRQRKRARALLVEGMDALHDGQWQRAESLLAKACDDDEVGHVARLCAARAASQRGDEAASQAHLARLAEPRPRQHAVAVAELALAGGDAEAALRALEAPAAQPLPPRGLVLQAQALAAVGRAGEAYGLLGAIRKQNAVPPAAFSKMEAELAARSIETAADANVLAERWETLPKPLRAEPAIVACYASRAATLGWEDAATHSIEQALESRWDESLATLYGRLPIGKLDSRRASAQHWLAAHPDSPGLLLSLARLARRQGQWPQAQDYLHRAIAQGAGAEAWEELGHGYAANGEDGLARRSFANALNASRGEAVQALPGRDLRERIHDLAVVEERDEHGLPRLRPLD